MVLLAILGIVGWLGLWLGHDEGVPNPSGAGEWRSVPTRLRLLFRRDPGPVLIGTVFVQLAFLSWVVLYLIDVFAQPFVTVGYYFMVGSWVAVAVSWAAVWWRSRRW